MWGFEANDLGGEVLRKIRVAAVRVKGNSELVRSCPGVVGVVCGDTPPALWAGPLRPPGGRSPRSILTGDRCSSTQRTE